MTYGVLHIGIILRIGDAGWPKRLGSSRRWSAQCEVIALRFEIVVA